MKALSVWQPWASLIVTGNKKIETRGWRAPPSIIGQRIAIASTKTVGREQRAAAGEPSFLLHYADTGLPPLDDMPMGCVLGSVIVESCRAIDPELLDGLDAPEEAFGWYGPGRFVWFLTEPELFQQPVCARGGQGLWNWSPA